MNTCYSCGRDIPSGQKVCSLCYGDPDYGTDGYYAAELEEEHFEEERREEQRQTERKD